MNFIVRTATIAEIHPMTRQIPEFIDPYPIEEYKKRLSNAPNLVLAAFDRDKIIGFKIGYERGAGVFYSWMGAVLPNYRKLGVAKALVKRQEEWALEQNYQKIQFKTRNKLRSMLLFAIKNDFNIIGIIEKETIGEYRIIMEKKLK